MKYTLWGLYQYDPTLFQNCIVPDGMSKDILIDVIMEKSGMLYPAHQQPDYFKRNITNWFSRRLEPFTKMWSALTAEYSPIENYDRYEEWEDSPNITKTLSGGNDVTTTRTGGMTNTDTKGGGYTRTKVMTGGHIDEMQKTGTMHENTLLSGGHIVDTEGTNTNTVSAYNSNAYEPNTQDTGKTKETVTYNDQNEDKLTEFNSFKESHSINYEDETETETLKYNGDTATSKTTYDNDKSVASTQYKNQAETEEGTTTHTGHLHGNIGVTTNQQMINEELKLRQYDLYNHIAQWFETEFLIQVY